MDVEDYEEESEEKKKPTTEPRHDCVLKALRQIRCKRVQRDVVTLKNTLIANLLYSTSKISFTHPECIVLRFVAA